MAAGSSKSEYEYVALVHEASPEGGYWAEAVGLTGCVRQGETLEELEANLIEAIEAVTGAPIGNPRLALTRPS